MWICEPFCFFTVSLGTYKSMLLKVIVLSKPIIQFLGFLVTQRQFSFLSQGRGTPFSPLWPGAESGWDHGVAPSLCTSPSLAVWYNTLHLGLLPAGLMPFFKQLRGWGSSWTEGAQAGGCKSFNHLCKIHQSTFCQGALCAAMKFSWNGEQASLASPGEKDGVGQGAVPPVRRLLPPAQMLLIPLHSRAPELLVPCEHRAEPTWQADKSWMACGC